MNEKGFLSSESPTPVVAELQNRAEPNQDAHGEEMFEYNSRTMETATPNPMQMIFIQNQPDKDTLNLNNTPMVS